MAAKNVRIIIMEGEEIVLDDSMPTKVFKTGRQGYFRNANKIVINGVEHNANLMLTATDVTKQRAGESDEAYQARLAEIKGKNSKPVFRNGLVRTVKA